jgi:hypothetical protein
MKKKNGIVTMSVKEYNKMTDQIKDMIKFCDTVIEFHDYMTKMYDHEVNSLKELRVKNRKFITSRKKHTKVSK